MRSLSAKLAIAFLVVSLTGIALVGVLTGQRTRSEVGEMMANQAQVWLANQLADYYQAHGGWVGVAKAGIMPLRDAAGNVRAVRRPAFPAVVLVDHQGQVVIATSNTWTEARLPSDHVAARVPIMVDGVTVGHVVSLERAPQAPTSDPEYGVVQRVINLLTQATLGAVVLALLLSLLLSRALTRPIRELTLASQSLAAGNLGQQVPVRSQDELGNLARAFNHMSSELARGRLLRRQMTADIAHELRTPLSLILGHAEALSEGVLPPTPEALGTIHDEAQRLSRLVEDLRTLSLSDAGELSLHLASQAAGELLERAAAWHRAEAASRGIALAVEVQPDLPPVCGDVDRLAQVLHNLLSNALRHTPEGGRIALSAQAEGEGVRLAVADTGSGIAPEDLPRVFDRFYRSDASRQRQSGGSGLGLAIAKSLVEAHGGRIWAESELGRGATFCLTLPAERE